MKRITTAKQERMLEDLRDVMIEIRKEAEDDKDFESFIHDLGIFDHCIEFVEIVSILEDNTYPPCF